MFRNGRVEPRLYGEERDFAEDARNRLDFKRRQNGRDAQHVRLFDGGARFRNDLRAQIVAAGPEAAVRRGNPDVRARLLERAGSRSRKIPVDLAARANVRFELKRAVLLNEDIRVSDAFVGAQIDRRSDIARNVRQIGRVGA